MEIPGNYSGIALGCCTATSSIRKTVGRKNGVIAEEAQGEFRS